MAKQNPESADEQSGASAKAGQGKKGPTPKRRDREAQNYRPLVPEDRKEARRQLQAQQKKAQNEAREGYARGEDRYLRPTERGPQKRFMRDYIDARYSLGEILLPLMFLVIFATFIPNRDAGIYAMAFIWAYLVLAIGEAIVVANIIKRRIAAVVGPENVEKGIILGTLARILQMRFLRMPRARVKRGSKPEFTARYS